MKIRTLIIAIIFFLIAMVAFNVYFKPQPDAFQKTQGDVNDKG